MCKIGRARNPDSPEVPAISYIFCQTERKSGNSAKLLPLAVGAATGVLSGFGVGGGTLLLVYMTAFAGVEQRLAQGINLLYFLPAGLLALPAHVKNGYIETPVLLPAIGAGLACAALAAWAATAMEVELLRKLFGAFLIVVGLMELFTKPDSRSR